MPFLDEPPSIDLGKRVDIPKGFTVTPGADALEEFGPPRPGWNWGAAFRRNNEFAALAASESAWQDNAPEPGFNPWDKIKGTEREGDWNKFVLVRNQKMFDAVSRDIDRENEDRKILASQPWWQGFITEGAAGILSPTTFLPGGTLVKGAKGGMTLRSALNVGLATGASAAAQETMLQGIERTRTFGESATAIGASTFLGGLLGAGGAALLSKAEWQKAVTAIERDIAAPARGDPADQVLQAAASPASIGAAANVATDIADNSIAGRMAGGVAAATAKMNPLLRALHSPSAVFRDVMLNTVENPLYLKKNFDGVASAPAVETLMKEYNAGLARSIEATNEAFSEHVKAGGQLDRAEFRDAVGRAMRRGDTDADPAVAKAAQEWRAKVFDPLKKAAIETGQLPADVSVDTAASYFSRMWNTRALVSRESEFKEIASNYFRDLITKEYEKSVSGTTYRVARLDQEIADLKIAPEARAGTIADLDQKIADLYRQDPDLGGMADRVTELRGDIVRARRAGDQAALKTAQEEMKAIREKGGTGLAAYQTNLGELRVRRRNVDLGVAGIQERSDRVLMQLADLEEANHRSMERLIKKGQKLERDLDRLDADALEARVSQLADQYSAIARRAEASAERAKQEVQNINRRAAAKEVRNIEKGAEIAAESDTKITQRLEKEQELQAKRAAEMAKVAERLEAAKGLDHDALMAEIKGAIDKATRETSSLSLARGERAASLGERLANLDPKRVDDRIKTIGQMKDEITRKFHDRWEIRHLGEGVSLDPKVKANFGESAKAAASEVFNTLTGKTLDGSVRPEFITIKGRGPLKERTFNIPDALVEQFLEHDVEVVGRRYTRVMGADVELARKFGSVDMAEQIGKIRDDYAGLRSGITDEKARRRLSDREKSDIGDLEAMRDMLRGTNPGSAADGNYARVVRTVNHLNYLRSMGEVALASLSETVRPAMVHGLMPFMSTLGQTLTNLKGIRLSVKEAQLAGSVTEHILGTRLATLSEIVDPYASRGPIESFMEAMTNVASKWNGIRLLTDMQKSIAAVMTQNRILRGAEMFGQVAEKERAYLNFMGIDQSMAERIAKQFAEHGETAQGVRVANTEKWTDDVALRTYRAAINKDVDSIIATKGVADTPLFANTPTGRAFLQFKGFGLASHQRYLLRGLQEDQARFMGGIVAMTTIGIMTTWLKAVSGNRTEKLEEITTNPGWWIAEGLDRAGIFSVPVELANAFEKASGFNFIKTPLKAFDEKSAISQKNQNRSLWGSIGGPSVGLVDDASTVIGVPKKLLEGEEITQGQKNAAERLLPFNSYLGVRQMLRYVVNPQQP